MTLAENERSEIRSESGIILDAKHTAFSNSQTLLETISYASTEGYPTCEAKWDYEAD